MKDTIQEAALSLLELGYSVFPAYPADHPEFAKKPIVHEWKPYQSTRMDADAATRLFKGDVGIAVVGGAVSGNLECLDFDNPELFKPFMDTLEGINPELAGRLIQRQTPSGGYHLQYRCAEPVGGNTILAKAVAEVTGPGKYDEPWPRGASGKCVARQATGGRWYIEATAIETRGEGGYFLTPPSSDYTPIKGTLRDCPTITAEEVTLLHTLAVTFDERAQQGTQEATRTAKSTAGGGRPGDQYNADWGQNIPALLEKHDWQAGRTVGNNQQFTRPGKTDGSTGGTLRQTDGIFYCWSSNASPLEPGKAYDPLGLLAALEHGGDIAAAVKAVAAMGYGDRRRAATGNSTEPEAPRPLPDGLAPVAPFDMALLPESLRSWVEDIADRVQCPPDYLAVTVMGALGSVIGRKIGIRPQRKTDWTITPNQWGLIVGRPGVLKTPALEAALAPLKRLAASAIDAHRAAEAEYQTVARLHKLQVEEGEKRARKALAGGGNLVDAASALQVEAPEPPVCKRYIAVDSNVASLGELHMQNLNGLLVHRDELVSLLKALDREDHVEERGFYLTGWSGDSAYTFDRIGRGLNLHIPAVCLSLIGGTQPGRLSEYIGHAVKGGAGDDGLIQRFGLMVWPDTNGQWRNVDCYPNSEAKRAAYEVFTRMDNLTAADAGAEQDTFPDGQPDGIPYLRFDQEAGEAFLEWRTALETRLRSGDLSPALESHFSKYRKLIPGLALLLHLADGGTGPVTLRPTLQALAWGEYLETHALRCYGSGMAYEVMAAKAVLKRLERGDLKTPFTSRDVWRPQWRHLPDKEAAHAGLSLLVDYGWLRRIVDNATGGRPATMYEVTDWSAST